MRETGEWALRILALTLIVSPVRQLTGWSPVMKLRRMLGLYAFFYGCVHLLAFLQFFVGWSFLPLLGELAKRPYITVGFAAWCLMLPLAVTSTRGMQRRLGRSWQRLHRLIYPAAVFACLHLLWQARSDIGEALVYIAMFTGLLGWRIYRFRCRHGTFSSTRAGAPESSRSAATGGDQERLSGPSSKPEIFS
jgi:sulfoxide reductase heme-binding subunit YedZ